MYKKLSKQWQGNHRADIIISKKNSSFNYINDALFVIEVKRKEAPKNEVNEDLKRLAKLKRSNKNIRCFLLYVSANERPKQFVNKSGKARKRKIKIDENYIAIVRQVKKAIDKFYTLKNGKKINNAIDKAHYACFIEVKENKITT